MKIFLSAVSVQFESCRNALRSDLSAVGVEVKTQEDFQQSRGTLLEKLDTYIASCDRVIVLVGDVYGAEPPQTLIPSEFPRRSYTQWEYIFATGERLNGSRNKSKEIFLYFALPEFLSKHLVGQALDCLALQENFIEMLYKSGKDYNYFGSLHELRALVLRDGFHLGSYTPQPLLTLNVLRPSYDNRFVYRSRQIPFVGREAEWAALDNFLAGMEDFQWIVVSGLAGSGKSRLMFEFCLSLNERWQAGFLSQEGSFNDWASWKPSADTLIVIDYAAERVDEIKRLLIGLVSRPDKSLQHKVRIVLVDREADDEWLSQIIGSRSHSYTIEAVRYPDSPIVLGSLNRQALWELMYNVSCGTALETYNQNDLLEQLHKLDSTGRPLYAIFAADSIASGHKIHDWNRTRLMRDVIEREREGWRSSGITMLYENLLCFATLSGGLTEAILKNPPLDLRLPPYNEFDRSLYSKMTGYDVKGHGLPGLKPDLLGEFFVLCHVKRHNGMALARNVEILCEAGWATTGSNIPSKLDPDGTVHVEPSSFMLFLERLITDFIEDPITPLFLYKPKGLNVKLFFWHDLMAIAIKRYLEIGYHSEAKKLYEELKCVSLQELRYFDAEQFVIKAAFSLLPYSVGEDKLIDGTELLGHCSHLLSATSASLKPLQAFFRYAAESASLLMRKDGENTFLRF